MKKKLISVFLLFACTSIFAQEKFFGPRVGLISPKDAENGLKFGFNYGKFVDNKIDFFTSFDFYLKKDENKKLISQNLSEIESKNTMIYIPFLLNLKMKFPIDNVKLDPYLLGGLGGSVLFVDIYEKAREIDEFTTYYGFNMQIGAGGEFQFGDRSKLYFETYYLSGKMSGGEETLTNNVKMVKEINMGGIGFRMGLIFNI